MRANLSSFIKEPRRQKGTNKKVPAGFLEANNSEVVLADSHLHGATDPQKRELGTQWHYEGKIRDRQYIYIYIYICIHLFIAFCSKQKMAQ